jgi:hypothetical protein
MAKQIMKTEQWNKWKKNHLFMAFHGLTKNVDVKVVPKTKRDLLVELPKYIKNIRDECI